MRGYLAVKRVFDFCVAALALFFLSPLIAFIAWKIKKSDGGPVFYLSWRIGQGGNPFKIYKFRTMVVSAPNSGPGITAGGDPRITPLGRTLRKWKLDELPQLFNILKGEMSLVGPRPEVERYVKLYSSEQNLVLQMKPGITGMASLAYRHEEEVLKNATGYASTEEAYIELVMPAKLELELQYYRQRSLLLDLKLLVSTFTAVLK